jgi:membrane protein
VKLPRRLQALVEAALRWRAVTTVRRIMQVYDAAGGGLLAGGLTFSALFALLPAVLLLTGILGFLVDDPERRRAIVRGLAEALPPLREILEASLEAAARGAVGFGVLGLLGLAWGASRFYGSLDDAFARIFRDAPARGFVDRTIRGLLTVLLLVGSFLAALVLTGIASFLVEQTGRQLDADVAGFWTLATPVAAALVFVVATVIIYRFVPARAPAWRALLPPALVAGLAMALLTQLFSYVAPRLIGTAALFGTFVAIFAAMIWLSLEFQLLLLGATWVRVRIGGERPGEEPPQAV